MPEILPKFNGEIKKYLSKNIIYPKRERVKGIQGTVYVSFNIGKDGAVSDVKIVRGIDSLLNKEAIRVVAKMPKWSPAQNGGQAIDYKYDLPVKFILPKRNSTK